MAPLPTEALDLGNGHPDEARGLKGGFHVLQTEGLDDGFYFPWIVRENDENISSRSPPVRRIPEHLPGADLKTEKQVAAGKPAGARYRVQPEVTDRESR
jgi:hypothetical protein